MHLLGFSTGSLARGDVLRALEMLRPHGLVAVELSALREAELQPLLEAIIDLPLKTYEHICVHAPSKLTELSEREVCNLLLPLKARRWPQVSIILEEVFQEEDIILNLETRCAEGLLGLDEEHSAFLRILFSRKTWSSQDIRDAAMDLGLMPDGALERINEASLACFDEMLLEGEEPLEINPELMERLLRREHCES